MKNLRLLKTCGLSLLALSLTSLPLVSEETSRTIASCIEGSSFGGNTLALRTDLMGEVQTEAFRTSQRDWYYYLSQVEMRAYSDRQAMRTSFGLSGPLFPNMQPYGTPTIVPFQLQPAPVSGSFAMGGFRGFASTVASPGPAFSLPTVGIATGASFFTPPSALAFSNGGGFTAAAPRFFL